MNDLVIFGSGGFGREVHQLVLDVNAQQASWNLLGFLDGDPSRHGTAIHDLEILGDESWLADRPAVDVVVAVGSTAAKRRVVRRLAELRHPRFASLVHPSAWVGRGVRLGPGSLVCAGSLLTTDIEVAEHVILNLDCTVGHDSRLADFVTAAPSVNVSGQVTVGEGCDLGTGSTIIQGVEIGRWSVVGAGAVVVRDVPPNTTAVGVPAKPIKSRPDGWYE